MKQITFNVESPKMASANILLIKDVHRLGSRIYFKPEINSITVKNVENNMVESVTKLVSNYYVFTSSYVLDEDELIEKRSSEPTMFGSKKFSDLDKDDSFELKKEESETEYSLDKQDLSSMKIAYQKEYIQVIISKIMKTAYWAMFKKNVHERDIANLLYSCLNEMSLCFSPNDDTVEFEIGDVVECNYGYHLQGEINGSRVHSIICDVKGDMAYVVPIVKADAYLETSYSFSCLPFTSPEDIQYENELFKGGIVLLNGGKYVRIERFKSLLGKTSPAFFEKVLEQLATQTFDFRKSKEKVTKKIC